MQRKRDPLVGQQLGPYRLLHRIGEGGMGAVYEAEHLEQRAFYAIKILHPHYSNDAAMVARLQREAQVASRLRHANIIYVADAGHDPEFGFYLVMELLRGRGLDDLLREERMLPLQRVADITYQVIDALVHAHSLGVIHRDLKPGNVFLIETVHNYEQVKLVDFGIAHIAVPTTEQPANLTNNGKSIGTPEYMPPEQILSESHRIGPATDIYALSVMLFRLLTGSLPFTSKNFVELLNQVMGKRPPILSSLRPRFEGTHLERLLFQCMAKNPRNRLPRMEEFQFQFQRALEDDPLVQERGLLEDMARYTSLGIEAPDLNAVPATMAIDNDEYEPESNKTYVVGGQTFRFDGAQLIQADMDLDTINALLHESMELDGVGATQVLEQTIDSSQLASVAEELARQEADVPTSIFARTINSDAEKIANILSLPPQDATQIVKQVGRRLSEEPEVELQLPRLSPPSADSLQAAEILAPFREAPQRPPTKLVDRPKSGPQSPGRQSSLTLFLLFFVGFSIGFGLLIGGYLWWKQRQDLSVTPPTQATQRYRLAIRSRPSEAQVVVQGKVLGTTPLQLTQKVGRRVDFVLKKRGYRFQRGTWLAHDNQEMSFVLRRLSKKVAKHRD